MNPEQIEKNRQDVIKLVEEAIPSAKEMVQSDAEVVVTTQEAFAFRYEISEIILLGAFVKYCGMHGKKVEITVEKKEEQK